MKRAFVSLPLLFILVLLFACKKDKPDTNLPINLPPNTTPYTLSIPEGFPQPVLSPDNPLTVQGVQLGRKLYYEPMLDKNQSRSCASCHIQQTAFSNNLPDIIAHQNMAWDDKWLWNGKIEGSLEQIMRFEVEDFFETNVALFNQSAEYKDLFFKAFGVTEITSKEMAYALAQFARTLISGNSKYDKAMRGEAFLSDLETDGFLIFFSETGDCFHCHFGPFFTDFGFHDIGLDSIPEGNNLGRFTATGNERDKGKFATPSLRNIEMTAPYMHDGRFATLEEVVEHYNGEVRRSPNVDPILTSHGTGIRLNLTEYEKQALVAFLRTLTDHDFLTNPELSAP